jgi:hypothetical protein
MPLAETIAAGKSPGMNIVRPGLNIVRIHLNTVRG